MEGLPDHAAVQALSLPTQIFTAVAALALFAIALWRAPWKSWLEGHPDRQHAWGFGLLLTAALSWLRIDAAPGLSLQLLIVTTMTLMHGWELALVANGIVLAISCLFHGAGQWASWPIYFLCDVAFPAGFITIWHHTLARRLPKIFATYFFATVFAGSIIAFLLAGMAKIALLAVSSSLPGAGILGDYAVLLVMLGFAQGTINGMVMAGAIMCHPEWVGSFDPKVYFRR